MDNLVCALKIIIYLLKCESDLYIKIINGKLSVIMNISI